MTCSSDPACACYRWRTTWECVAGLSRDGCDRSTYYPGGDGPVEAALQLRLAPG